MSIAELAPVLPLRVPVADEDELSQLRRALDLARLVEAGYEPAAEAATISSTVGGSGGYRRSLFLGARPSWKLDVVAGAGCARP